MFCSKCGKTIDDNATFCAFCGNTVNGAASSAPVETAPQSAAPQQAAPQYSAPQQVAPQQAAPQQAAPQYSAPQQAAPQYSAPQQGAPQYGAPQQGAPQYGAPQQGAPQYGAPQQAAPQYGAPQQGAPQYGAPQGQYGYPAQPGPVLTPAAINIINMILKGILAVLGLLILIGSIGSLASLGALKHNVNAGKSLVNFMGLARVPAIIAFSFIVIDVVFMLLAKQKSILTYINAGIGVILFTFNFVMYGSVYGSEPSDSAFIVASVFLLVGSVALIASTMITLLKKEQLLFRPRAPRPPMPPTPPSYPPYQQ